MTPHDKAVEHAQAEMKRRWPYTSVKFRERVVRYVSEAYRDALLDHFPDLTKKVEP